MSDIKFINIEPTNLCNYSCLKCIHFDNDINTLGYMSKDVLNKILKKMPNTIEYIGMSGIGEPLMNPNFFKLIDICKNNINASIGFHTNGALLNKKNIHKIINREINDISISIDAANQKTYEVIHNCKHSLGKIIDNISYLINLKNKYKLGLRVTASYLIHEENIGELSNFIELAYNLGVDYIGPINIINPIFGYEAKKWESFLDDTKEEIKRGKIIAKELGVQIDFPDLSNKKAGSANISPIESKSCAFPFTMYPLIAWDGSVYPCIWLQGINKYRIGNLLNDSLDYIINCEKIKSIRDIFNLGKYLPECVKCKPGGFEYDPMEFESINI